MEARAGNSILDFETLFSDFQESLNGSSLAAYISCVIFQAAIKSTADAVNFCIFCLQGTCRSYIFFLMYDLRSFVVTWPGNLLSVCNMHNDYARQLMLSRSFFLSIWHTRISNRWSMPCAASCGMIPQTSVHSYRSWILTDIPDWFSK